MEPINLEIWRTHGALDWLCQQFNNTMWEAYTGPHPETDTHPNCRCTRDVFSTTNDTASSPMADAAAAGVAAAANANAAAAAALAAVALADAKRIEAEEAASNL